MSTFSINTNASIATLLAAYNEVADKPRKSFASRTVAFAAFEKIGLDVIANSQLADQVLTTPRPGPKTATSTSTIAYTGATPFARPRTARHARLVLMAEMNGKTVSEFYAACREQGIPCSKKLFNIAIDKGFVTLRDAA